MNKFPIVLGVNVCDPSSCTQGYPYSSFPIQWCSVQTSLTCIEKNMAELWDACHIQFWISINSNGWSCEVMSFQIICIDVASSHQN
jgi:hypothetical protein